MHPRDQTIFALSSGLPPAAIAIVRVSGEQARVALQSIAGRLPMPRIATRVTLRDVAQQDIDDALVLWFPGPASATGEDVAEFHVHGGRAVLAAIFAALSALADTRAADPGEFTRRAFENGKLDLTEAEALNDLIHADTDRQRAQALRQVKGLLGDRARDWRERLIAASALIEAGIDFSDEGDVPAELMAPALTTIRALADEIEEVLAAQGQSERLRDGIAVAIAGAPNVGKSTLLNRLARREVAIVSPIAGTTRDVIEVHLDLDGYPVTLIDTAGVRDSDDPVEQEGVRRAKERALAADLVLWLSDRGREAVAPDDVAGVSVPVWQVSTKIDVDVMKAAPRQRPGVSPLAVRADGETRGAGRGARRFSVSAVRGDGIDDLVAAIGDFAGQLVGTGEHALIGRTRQRELLRSISVMLRRSITVAVGDQEELVAEELRAAAVGLGKLLGRVDVEDILDAVFRDFCIGK